MVSNTPIYHEIELLNYKGSDWLILKNWLLEKQRVQTALLIGSDSHDQSQKIRGALAFIQQVLQLEKQAANQAAQNRT